MTDVSLIFPHQLFQHHPAIASGRPILIVEDALFFSQYHFHKNKLVLHRASMMEYKHQLTAQGLDVDYVEAKDNVPLEDVFKNLTTKKISRIHYCDTTDYLLERRIKRYASRYKISLVQYQNPNFICTTSYLDSFFRNRNRYFLTDFYIEQRKRFGILLENDKPAGGQWTYDIENRKKLPSSVIRRLPVEFKQDAVIKDATDYVETYFELHNGTTNYFNYPVTTHQAKSVLEDFLKNRFTLYGTYQDAILKEDSRLFHSLLTPSLNIGLLTPQDILEHAVDFGRTHRIPINSIEGFVRQILGWREFVRAVYEREGVTQRTSNHWGHSRKIPKSFWDGTTGIEPVDNVIKKVLTTGYCNHIERLMIMGNFMLLCEFDPQDVYRWFMELFIDSYDWVMVPNVYGMSQYADGGKMCTKPYISSSNYVLKMSNFRKGDWCEIWDALYWRFIELHQAEFIRNPRMTMMVKQLEKMDKEKKEHLKSVAEKFFGQL